MAANLNDIITKQLPDNSAAIAHARSYGDLKENAEYKAAKERQAYLQRRRDEIDQSIIRTQPVDFSLQRVEKTVIPGSTVTISYKDNNKQETFYLLGIWDSDPDTNCIAYTTGLGKVLNGKLVNDEITLPDGRDAVIVKLEPLPTELLNQLNVE
jgi:transcription elongation GreA/GreB family factor